MRRQDKQIGNREQINEIIEKCLVCRVGFAKDNQPYVVPVSFGYDGQAIYFHSAREGMKIDFISTNSKVCFEFENGVELQSNQEKPCNWSFSFQTVIGFGTVMELLAEQEKIEGLHRIMKQYSDQLWNFSEVPLTGLRVWKIDIDSLTGKQSKDFFTARLSA